MRRLTLPIRFLSLIILFVVIIVIAVIHIGVVLFNNRAAANAADNAPVLIAAPILSEEVPLSAAQPLKAKAFQFHAAKPVNPHLSLLEDDGAAIAASHAYTRPQGSRRGDILGGGTLMSHGQTSPFGSDPNMSVPDNLMNKLRTTESSFVGIGLEGKAMVNGEVFSWANVNLSNISYG